MTSQATALHHNTGPGITHTAYMAPTTSKDIARLVGPEQILEDGDERVRGRRRSRDYNDSFRGTEAGSGDDDSATGGPTRKRRRSRKGLDKKFDCPHDGCGKSYSRAEHLYRHQLNHNPKQIYRCDFPECRRSFVRQDLCARHKERHTARGSQLQRKDAFLNHTNQSLGQNPESYDSKGGGGTLVEEHEIKSDQSSNSGPTRRKNSAPHAICTGPVDSKPSVISPKSATSSVTLPGSASPQGVRKADTKSKPQHRSSISSAVKPIMTPKRSSSDNSFVPKEESEWYDASSAIKSAPPASFDTLQSHSNFGPVDGTHQQNFGQQNVTGFMRPSIQTSIGTPSIHSLSLASPYQATPMAIQASNGSMQFNNRTSTAPVYPTSHSGYVGQQGMSSFTLPPPGYSTQSQTSSTRSEMNLTTSPPTSLSSMDHSAVPNGQMAQSTVNDPSSFDQMATPYFTPFGDGLQGLNRSPFAITDDFATWLFSEAQLNNQSPIGRAGQGRADGFGDPVGAQFQPSSFVGNEISMNDFYPHMIPQQHPMAVTSILDTSLPESVLSEEKRKMLIELIESRFNERNHAPVAQLREAVLDGDLDEDNQVLSLRMMQIYIGSYWYHFHPQLPILHKPTFVADKTQNLLLLAMMAIGASCLDKVHGNALTDKCAELSIFLAWHLRSEIFNDAEFFPPAKLWVFQALLLLEIYEKMYSTRALHERAHIHHATTITLMRRGSSLIGRSTLDSPPSTADERSAQLTNGMDGGHQSSSITPDKWWSRWIKSEATRRVAFAAFAIDSTHATMFGHSAVMIAHEMGQQRLPCDEALWSATSSAEVGRIEASLQANGVRPMHFLTGLKKTLSGDNVRTNSFGRTILMAGLLSVSWHMNQKDLQVNSLGVSQALGGRDKWRKSLTRAYDLWKQDFDNSLAQSSDPAASNSQHYSKGTQEDNVFESRTVLHHLAHMAMHVDVVDCQIYAGAARLLGRAISTQDFEKTQKRMKEWAPSAQARDATFYALRFLSEVLISDQHQTHQSRTGNTIRSPTLLNEQDSEYSARDDFLINRPWVLYFAALIVWSYGYAHEGPVVQPVPSLASPEEKHHDMRMFLERVGAVRTPDDLADIRGRNSCLGMLMVLRDAFRKTRWELLHEAANLLKKCVDKLNPPTSSAR
ncbi:MAG: hypothetical protein M1837_006355 [Sclerophora amabilis]|nr:MAG: hypothetical protein M1837_006355 [Sclerophora amabilis]